MNTHVSTESAWLQLSSDLREFIHRRVPDDHAAEDLLQETFLRIHQHIGRLRQKGQLAAWVYQIARNVITYHFRRRKSSGQLSDDQCVTDESAQQVPTNAAKWLDEWIQQVPEKYRQPFNLPKSKDYRSKTWPTGSA